jgi:hypothetical protein
VGAGALIGLSCWLRANALLLPLFGAVAAAWVSKSSKRLSAALAVISGAIFIIAPITIKNAVVFHRFVPVSLGAGQTLLEGIADYDTSLGVPQTDMEIIQQEAQIHGRPEYAEGLFNVDGIERDRSRTARALGIISSRPLWFGSVVARRAVGSMRLDPVPVLSPEPPLSHSNAGSEKLIWGLNYIRQPIRVMQRFFTTALFIPFVLIGIALAVYLRKKKELVLLLVVPIYYLTVQSLLHTERRYVYVIHFFFTVFASLALCWLGGLVFQQLRKLRRSAG